MNTRCLPFAAALTFAVSVFSAAAQPASAPALPSASAPAAKPAPRPLSPNELRESASPPGDLRPENPVKPQISIPLGSKPVPPLAPEPRAQRRIGSASAVAGGINDASARCEAEVGDVARAACRRKLAQTNPRR
ncbi:MAG: hypothetical protein Q8R33_14855 [Burkholderiales bacterium]|nr:hypothetical protein [Burkholderiales bacterium]